MTVNRIESLISRILRSVHSDASIVSIAAALYFGIRYVVDHLGDRVSRLFTSSIRIRVGDDVHERVMAWISTHRVTYDSQHLAATSYKYDGNSDDEYNDEENDCQRGNYSKTDGLRNAVARNVTWTPSEGIHYFRHRGKVIALSMNQHQTDSEYDLKISCIGRSPDVLKELIVDAEVNFAKREAGRTHIYAAIWRYSQINWRKTMSRPTRPLETVILDSSSKRSIVDDMEKYLRAETRNWYSTRGIPYRRGYLFYGPPGTGKISLAVAIAGFFSLKIYTLNLNSPEFNEDTLTDAFLRLPRRCVLLLEDIDAVYMARSRMSTESSGGGEGHEPEPGQIQTRISLSVLLNVLDGAAAQEGRVLIMTSNHKDHIDPALLRPGRIDFKLRFEYARFDLVVDVFVQMYSEFVSETDELSLLASSFAEKIPDGLFSPADIQGFIMKYPGNPRGALEAVDEWVMNSLADNPSTA